MKKYHLLQYTENCSPKVRKFTSIKALENFVKNFNKKYDVSEGDNWIDYSVYNVTGELKVRDPSVIVEKN